MKQPRRTPFTEDAKAYGGVLLEPSEVLSDGAALPRPVHGALRKALAAVAAAQASVEGLRT